MSLGGIFDARARLERISGLESEIAKPDFWNNQERANNIIKELKALKSLLEPLMLGGSTGISILLHSVIIWPIFSVSPASAVSMAHMYSPG